MPCIECGESAKENGSFGVVVDITYDEDGNASYYCLNCTKKALKGEIEID